jgi:hypothetical protein
MASEAQSGPRDILRTVVLKTNRYWPFNHINLTPYRAAVRAFVYALGRRPEVRSIYLRRGLKPGGWIPGLSDIDLALIVADGLPGQQEHDFLALCHRRVRRLRTVFPMLGELEIVSEGELGLFLRHRTSSSTLRWTLLHGRIQDLPEAADVAWQRRAVKAMLWVYVDLLQPCLAKPDSFLNRQDIGRRVEKILSHLQPILSEAGYSLAKSGNSPGFQVATAAQTLERAIAIVDCNETRAPTDPRWFPEAEDRCTFDPLPISTMKYLHSAIRMRDRIFFIIADGLEPQQIAQVFELSSQAMRPAPVLLAQRVFRYLVRHYNPFQFSMLHRDRTILFGADPLAEIEPPGRPEFTARALDQLGNVLLFTRSEELFRSSSTWLAEFQIGLRSAMAVQVLLRPGWISARPDQIVARWHDEFPELSRMSERIERDAAEGREAAARRGAFDLFRSIAGGLLAEPAVQGP